MARADKVAKDRALRALAAQLRAARGAQAEANALELQATHEL